MNKNNVIYRFLFDPKYRVGRHLLLICVLAIISFNQVFIAYRDVEAEIGNRIYLVCFLSLFQYLLFAYVNYYFLVPKYLMAQKHKQYIAGLMLLVFALPLLSVGEEYLVRTILALPHRITDYTSPLIPVDCLSSGMIMLPCFLGMTAIVLFRKWAEQNEYAGFLEHQQIQAEVNKLKGKITPAFFSHILQNASGLASTNPIKASDMLMRLSQLLRYQLYDCDRDKVLLSAEINFIRNFLDLNKVADHLKTYKLETEGDMNNIFVPPLLFLSTIQHAVNNRYIQLKFRRIDNKLLFECSSCDNKLHLEQDLLPIRKQLNMLYPNKYKITISDRLILLQLTV